MLYNEDVITWSDNYEGKKFHALFCDPPYHLEGGFMDKEWDQGDIAFNPETWSGISRHLYPGAYGFVFGGAGTYHYVASAIERAGLTLHPSLFAWIYGSGMGRGTRVKDNADFDTHRYGKLALKPAIEPIICFRKEYEGSARDSIAKYGAGALNIDGARIPSEDLDRYPSNVILDANNAFSVSEELGRDISDYFHVVDSERFHWQTEVEKQLFTSNPMMYCPKASRKERDYGLDDLEDKKVGVLKGRQDGSFDGHMPTGKNDHPTVKPLALTTWLATLLLPPPSVDNRRLLVPFAGTGSEAIGAYVAGWEHVTMIEIDEHYSELARLRVEAYIQRMNHEDVS